MDEWVVWFYVEPFTLHLNKDRGWHLLSPIVLVLVPVPVPVPDTASVITPWDRRLSTMGMIRMKSSHKHRAISFLSVKGQRKKFLWTTNSRCYFFVNENIWNDNDHDSLCSFLDITQHVIVKCQIMHHESLMHRLCYSYSRNSLGGHYFPARNLAVKWTWPPREEVHEN